MKNFEKLLPSELEEIKKLIDEILEKIIGLRVTNLNYQLANKTIKCPNCNNNYVIKNGKKNGTQRYQCKICNKFFSISTHTLTSHLTLSYSKLLVLLQCLIDLDTIEQTANKLKLSKRETYNLRIKFISVLNNYNQTKLKGIVQADEKYIRINLKGTRKENMPRKTHRNGFEGKKVGGTKEDICILMAIDSFDNVFAKVVGLGQLTIKNLEDNFIEYLDTKSILVTDSKGTFVSFAKKYKLNFKAIPAKKHKTKDGYHIGEINSLICEYELMIKKFHGLSTRHLQEYTDLFRCRKILKYTYEYLLRNKKIYEYVLLQNSTLIANNVCKRKMPVDIAEHYNCDFK